MTRIAWAVLYDDPAQVFVAEDEVVLTRLLALKVVGQAQPSSLGGGALDRIRDALLDERWGDAVADWVSATGARMDVFPDEELWSAGAVEVELLSMQIRLSPIFEDPASEGPAPPGG